MSNYWTFCIKKQKKNFTRCQDVKTICYMFFFSKKSVHYESSTMYQVNRCQEWESKPSLSTKKKKFVNVKPVRFLHSTRSEMKKNKKKNKNKIKAYVEQVTTKKNMTFFWFSLARVPQQVLHLPFPGAQLRVETGAGTLVLQILQIIRYFIYIHT